MPLTRQSEITLSIYEGMTSLEIEGVLSTAQDGRTKDIRYRQRQFLSLHQWIVSNRTNIETAVRQDDHCSEPEAQFVLALTLQDLRRQYNVLNLKSVLEEEYRVKTGRNNAAGNCPEDVVYIVPEKFTTFYSVMSALFAGIAAGSCCIIEVLNQIHASIGRLLKTNKHPTNSSPPI